MTKILLVEDDDLMVRMYERVFTHAGYLVDIAKDGQEGWGKIQNNPPDLILLDVMMPNINGLELLAKIKADQKFKDMLVVLLTNLGIQGELDKAIKKGAVQYIIKSNHPPDEVLEMVRKILVDRGIKQ